MAKGIEIILIGADDSRYSLWRSLPLMEAAPGSVGRFGVEMAADPAGFLMPPMMGVFEDKQASFDLARAFQRIDVGKRRLALPLNILPYHPDVTFWEVKQMLERALTFRPDPNNPDSHLARLVVRSGDTDSPEGVQSRYIEVALDKPLAFDERLDNLEAPGWRCVASVYGSSFWKETTPRRSWAAGSLLKGMQDRIMVHVENPGDVAVPLTWTFKGILGKGAAASYGVPDVKLLGGAFNRRVDNRQRLIVTPLIQSGETVQVSSDRDRPPIMSDQGKARSRELLTLTRGTYLRNLLPEYTQPIRLGATYQKGGIPNFPPKTIGVEWSPMYYSAW